MDSPLKEGNMSLKKLIAIVIHVNANLNHITPYIEITEPAMYALTLVL